VCVGALEERERESVCARFMHSIRQSLEFRYNYDITQYLKELKYSGDAKRQWSDWDKNRRIDWLKALQNVTRLSARALGRLAWAFKVTDEDFKAQDRKYYSRWEVSEQTQKEILVDNKPATRSEYYGFGKRSEAMQQLSNRLDNLSKNVRIDALAAEDRWREVIRTLMDLARQARKRSAGGSAASATSKRRKAGSVRKGAPRRSTGRDGAGADEESDEDEDSEIFLRRPGPRGRPVAEEESDAEEEQDEEGDKSEQENDREEEEEDTNSDFEPV
jgi:hypothetical protein